MGAGFFKLMNRHGFMVDLRSGMVYRFNTSRSAARAPPRACTIVTRSCSGLLHRDGAR
jgi:hypothetical protein